MAHPNARLTPLTRWELVQTVRVDGYPVAEVAKRFNVSRATAHKCLRRYDAGGRAGLEDGKSRPRSSPVQTASASVSMRPSRESSASTAPATVQFRFQPGT